MKDLSLLQLYQAILKASGAHSIALTLYQVDREELAFTARPQDQEGRRIYGLEWGAGPDLEAALRDLAHKLGVRDV